MEIEIPFENKSERGNYFGHKVCYKCNQVYDARFSCCINCGSDVWGNLRTYENRDGKIYVNKKNVEDFQKVMYMKFGDINLAGATWGSTFQEKMKKYKFKKEDLVILHISILEDNIVRFVNIELITQKGIQQIIKDADKKKEVRNSSQD